MRPESAALLWDVHSAANRIVEFIDGIDGTSYAADNLRRSAVERQLEIVGEALKNPAKRGSGDRVAASRRLTFARVMS